MTDSERPDWYWEIAIATNAVVKGMFGAQGESGHICARTLPWELQVDCTHGLNAVVRRLSATFANELEDGDVVVIADKVVAACLDRIGPRRILTDPDPKTVGAIERVELAEFWAAELGIQIEPLHLLLADEYGTQEATVGTDDPNVRAGEIAACVRATTGRLVDVVISDTDTGIDVRAFLIGTLTLGATPLGSTNGLNLYEAMRCATAAEFVRGHKRGIPVVVCKPAERRRDRVSVGVPRGYGGFLDAHKEGGLTYA